MQNAVKALHITMAETCDLHKAHTYVLSYFYLAASFISTTPVLERMSRQLNEKGLDTEDTMKVSMEKGANVFASISK